MKEYQNDSFMGLTRLIIENQGSSGARRVWRQILDVNDKEYSKAIDMCNTFIGKQGKRVPGGKEFSKDDFIDLWGTLLLRAYVHIEHNRADLAMMDCDKVIDTHLGAQMVSHILVTAYKGKIDIAMDLGSVDDAAAFAEKRDAVIDLLEKGD